MFSRRIKTIGSFFLSFFLMLGIELRHLTTESHTQLPGFPQPNPRPLTYGLQNWVEHVYLVNIWLYEHMLNTYIIQNQPEQTFF